MCSLPLFIPPTGPTTVCGILVQGTTADTPYRPFVCLETLPQSFQKASALLQESPGLSLPDLVCFRTVAPLTRTFRNTLGHSWKCM